MENYLLDANGIRSEDERRVYTGRGRACKRTQLLQARTTRESEGAATQQQVDLHRLANQLKQIRTDLKQHTAPGCMSKITENKIKAANVSAAKHGMGYIDVKSQPDALKQAVADMHLRADTLANALTFFFAQDLMSGQDVALGESFKVSSEPRI
eukprot:TRINITY_DN2480_c0_g1_i1.p2 TRINITY_DN2480_c0_g1~~TRINITY_DN2480_c0_g1_i1.p2  ORF type:complete len:154 (+),score=39.25 TRINITY_DN2480_c0_g1_i1:2648-3109(+)